MSIFKKFDFILKFAIFPAGLFVCEKVVVGKSIFAKILFGCW
jgi:hypothetical protein